ncbi:hypothetical protein XA68_11590 [Ophiocordyceps unilateralis]|uniref:Uncharacterized protein n=1 Tax=Ophiocordyceps unilateralis TaxID=268505 RepID=A0A2A9P230_OPHUN|nr:hypothetical protein XA68_11590 [Ophiocordyceps unilateralis]
MAGGDENPFRRTPERTTAAGSSSRNAAAAATTAATTAATPATPRRTVHKGKTVRTEPCSACVGPSASARACWPCARAGSKCVPLGEDALPAAQALQELTIANSDAAKDNDAHWVELSRAALEARRRAK